MGYVVERYDGEMIELPDGVRLVECFICGSYHPQTFNGDCRVDEARFVPPDDSEAETESFDECDPRNPDDPGGFPKPHPMADFGGYLIHEGLKEEEPEEPVGPAIIEFQTTLFGVGR